MGEETLELYLRPENAPQNVRAKFSRRTGQQSKLPPIAIDQRRGPFYHSDYNFSSPTAVLFSFKSLSRGATRNAENWTYIWR
jgi:hypothetical protein